jgi:hypothetical protein
MREYVLGEVPMDVGVVGVKKVEKKKKKVMRKAVRVPPLCLDKVEATARAYQEADAWRHAEIIRDAWAKAGHVVEPTVESEYRGGILCWTVKLPLINGLPLNVFNGRSL